MNTEQLAQGCYAELPRVGLNPQPIDRKSNVLPVVPPHLDAMKLLARHHEGHPEILLQYKS